MAKHFLHNTVKHTSLFELKQAHLVVCAVELWVQYIPQTPPINTTKHTLMAATAMPPNKKAKAKAPKAPKAPKASAQSNASNATATQPMRQLLSLPQLSQYFNSLVQLVPPRFYFDTSSEQLDLKHMKKRERELAKAAIKNKGKVTYCTSTALVVKPRVDHTPTQTQANKRAKLDPEAAQTTLDVQQQQAAARAQQRNAFLQGAAPSPSSNGATAATTAAVTNTPATQPRTLTLNLDSADASKEELRERLRLKIEACRAQRHAEERSKTADEAKAWREHKLGGGGGDGKSKQGHKENGKGKKRYVG